MQRLFEGGPSLFPGLQCEDEERDEEGLISNQTKRHQGFAQNYISTGEFWT